jgi:CRISPR-associated protein Cmr2
MKYLFLFTVGPVQGFIAQARKTMDLQAGSDILSHLILTGMLEVQNTYRSEIIFPFLLDNAEAASMPNKFLAKVEISEKEAKAMGENIEAVVRRKLQNVAGEAVNNMGLDKAGQAFLERFYEQVSAHLEVYWLFEPLTADKSYREAYETIEQNLGAIKNIRAFKQLPPNEDGRKCSVSGERDALVFSDYFDLPAFAYSNRIEQIRKETVLLGKGEGLSAIVATKRFFDRDNRFSSVAQIAALAFENEMHGTLTETAYKCFKHLFAEYEKWDGQFLFEENLSDNYLQKNGIEHKASSNEVLRQQLKKLRRQIKEDKLPEISSYYAMLTFDGDRMGATWTGDESIVKPNADLESFQKLLAERLYHFAQKAKEYLDNGRGQTVYAGGDDFTGFVNLHYLFDVLANLRRLYRKEVHDHLTAYLTEDVELSFSAGVCIAHYKNPLGEVVRSANKAQKYAKDEDGGGRNAFAIYLMKRSGEIQRATIPWGEDLENLKALRTCVELMQAGCFSNTFITALNVELTGLVGRKNRFSVDFSNFDQLIRLEISRLVKRSKIEKGLKEYVNRRRSQSERKIIADMEASIAQVFKFGEDSKVENFLHWLEIADFLNRQPDHHAN